MISSVWGLLLNLLGPPKTSEFEKQPFFERGEEIPQKGNNSYMQKGKQLICRFDLLKIFSHVCPAKHGWSP